MYRAYFQDTCRYKDELGNSDYMTLSKQEGDRCEFLLQSIVTHNDIPDCPDWGVSLAFLSVVTIVASHLKGATCYFWALNQSSSIHNNYQLTNLFCFNDNYQFRVTLLLTSHWYYSCPRIESKSTEDSYKQIGERVIKQLAHEYLTHFLLPRCSLFWMQLQLHNSLTVIKLRNPITHLKNWWRYSYQQCESRQLCRCWLQRLLIMLELHCAGHDSYFPLYKSKSSPICGITMQK